ncbi:hypothetical protein ACWJKU_14855 [Methylocaldum sp. MU1018]
MDSLESAFLHIRTYSEGGKPSLHKPLLILFALGRCYAGHQRMIPFSDVDVALTKLFDEFYPVASDSGNTHYPFGRLETDGVWEVQHSSTLKRTSAGHLFKAELFEKDIHGGFRADIYQALASNADLINRFGNLILQRYFPYEHHTALRTAVGLPQQVEEINNSARHARFC